MPRKLDAGVLLEPKAAEYQRVQFGQNCDAIHFFPLNGRSRSRRAVCEQRVHRRRADVSWSSGISRPARCREPRVCETTISKSWRSPKRRRASPIVEVKRERGRWRFVKDSKYNRRITADTPINIGGPARGAALMKTKDDPAGERAFGTFANCAGGETPWGTYLTAEENIQDYFANLDQLKARKDVDPFIVDAHRRFRMWKAQSLYNWDIADSRFDLAVTPTEPFRFGWIVEIDPLDPTSTPIKRTALGRFAHEGASPVIARNGRVAVYMGDDDKFEYVYKFISNGRFDREESRGQSQSARSGHAARGALRCERQRAVVAVGVRSEGAAECRRGISRSGRCAHQSAHGCVSARRDADGSTGRCRSEPDDRPHLHRLHA